MGRRAGIPNTRDSNPKGYKVMPTTNKTQQTSQFDPQAMMTYQGLQSPLFDMLQGYMKNPFGNPFFQTQQQMGTRQAQGLGGSQMSNLLRNITTSGMEGGASSPAGLEMQQKIHGRSGNLVASGGRSGYGGARRWNGRGRRRWL